MIKVAVDAMGGDNAPVCNVKGAILALQENKDIEIILIGKEELIQPILSQEKADMARIHVVNAREVIETGDEPAISVLKKKDSSLVLGMKMLKNGEADAFVSAGSSGAILVGGQIIAGYVGGVRRAPLAVEIPTVKGTSLLLDCGANVDARPEQILQFAVMGSLYAKYIMNIPNPSVGLLNIGTEPYKGNALTREAYPLLEACDQINFMGNAEVRELPFGEADVYVCEAFAGNVALKTFEGTAKALMSQIKSALMSSVSGKMGGLLIKSSLKGLLQSFDASTAGGAPLLGLSGLVIKAHGNSTEVQIKNAIIQCIKFTENDLKDKIAKAIPA
ncbi:MAG: phosphate acyltransferase PlsX [Lachnospiraceae bacterium]|nr:phosphate acyltransferase PlsX [Lachnospiraceae bacterium]